MKVRGVLLTVVGFCLYATTVSVILAASQGRSIQMALFCTVHIDDRFSFSVVCFIVFISLILFVFIVSLVNSAFHPSEVGKSSTGLSGRGKAGFVHLYLYRVAGNTV